MMRPGVTQLVVTKAHISSHPLEGAVPMEFPSLDALLESLTLPREVLGGWPSRRVCFHTRAAAGGHRDESREAPEVGGLPF